MTFLAALLACVALVAVMRARVAIGAVRMTARAAGHRFMLGVWTCALCGLVLFVAAVATTKGA